MAESSKWEKMLEERQNQLAEEVPAKKSSFRKISAKLLVKGIDKYQEWQDKREEKQWEKLEKQTEKESERLIKQADKEMLASTSAKEVTPKATTVTPAKPSAITSKPAATNEPLSNLVYTFKLIHELKQEDDGNFIGVSIYGVNDNDDVVPFKTATKIFFKIIYAATSVAFTWQSYPDYAAYLKFRSWFNMFEENDGSYSFRCTRDLNGDDAVQTLNAALAQAGFSKRVAAKDKSIYVSLY